MRVSSIETTYQYYKQLAETNPHGGLLMIPYGFVPFSQAADEVLAGTELGKLLVEGFKGA